MLKVHMPLILRRPLHSLSALPRRLTSRHCGFPAPVQYRLLSNMVRQFAPLDPNAPSPKSNEVTKLEGIVFDVDGTLCEPQTYMFQEMRDAISCPKEEDILKNIYAKPASEQPAAWAALKEIEQKAMRLQKAQPGLVELMDYLEKRGVRRGLCTRNFDEPVTHLLSTFLPQHKDSFNPILTRDFTPPKPHAAPLLEIARRWQVDPTAMIMVGDSIDDVRSGRAAGATTVLLKQEHNKDTVANAEETDICISRLDELVGLLENGLGGGEEVDGEKKGR